MENSEFIFKLQKLIAEGEKTIPTQAEPINRETSSMRSNELESELKKGDAAAKALVQHMEDMGCASHCVFPVIHLNRDGRMSEWKITAELVAIIQ